MSYCQSSDVAAYMVGYDVNNTATSLAIEKSITRADNRINSYLSTNYDVSSWVSGISGVPSDLLFYAGFSEGLQPDWDPSAVAIVMGGVTHDLANARAHFSAGAMLLAEISCGACLTKFGQGGCIRLRYQPDVAGVPVIDDVFLISARNPVDYKSAIRIYHKKTSGDLTAEIYGSGATLLHSSVKNFLPTLATYHIEYNFNLDLGYERIFIDGIGGSQGAVTGARLDADAQQMNIGAKLSLTTSFPGYTYGYITDIETFDETQHLSDFESEIPIAKRVIAATPNTIPPEVSSLSEQLASGYAMEMLSRGSKESLARAKQIISDAIAQLVRLASGEANLVDSSGELISESTDNSSIYCNTEDYATTFNEDSPLKWKVSKTKKTDISSERL